MWQRICTGVFLMTLLTAQAPSPPPGMRAIDLPARTDQAQAIKIYVARPTAAPGTRLPVVVALHGCGGLFNAKGEFIARERDWLARFLAAGYAVVYPDSFNPRGVREVCTLKASERPVNPRGRVADIAAALEWLKSQPDLDPTRVGLVGWSHGGSTTLWSADKAAPTAVALKLAIAFYPGCRPPSKSASWQPGTPLTILIGDADDWTPVAPCRDLADRHPSVKMIEYPGAVHGFDAPNSPLRTRTGLGLAKDGKAKVGTDPKARAAAIDEVMKRLADAFK